MSIINPISIAIGGSKGHVVEQLDGPSFSTFAKAFTSYRWKMIPNCTGRYTCRDHNLVSNLHPSLLMQRILSESECDSGSESESLGKSNNSECSTETSTIYTSTTFNSNGHSNKFRMFYFEFPNKTRKDPIIVIPFDKLNRTGFISYVKIQKQSNTEDHSMSSNSISFVHTLNAPSGFQRKLNAIGITVTDDHDIIQKEDG